MRLRTSLNVLLLAALLGAGGLSAGDARGDDARPGPSPFAKATQGAKALPGFLHLWEKDGKVLAQLTNASLNRDFLLMASVSRGIGARYPFYTGTTLNPDYLMAFRRANGDKIQLVRRVTRYRAEPGTPMERAVKMSFSDAVVSALPIIAEEGGKILVDLGPVFLSDFLGLGPYLSRSLGGSFNFDPSKSQWGTVKSFEKNTELRVETVFSGRGDAGEDIVPDPRGVTLVLHYTLRDLSDLRGYQPRVADDRIGYFLTVHKNFSSDGPDSFVRYINRWRLEKADPKAARSAPKEPIVYWIENTVPYKWRSWLRQGIESWNVAFEQAGIVGAIEVRQMPDDADWDPEDARFNTLRWVTSTELGYGAIGPSRVNPLTGEILDADILVESEVVRNFSNIYSRYTPKARLDDIEAAWDDVSQHFEPRGLCTAGLFGAEEAGFGVLAMRLLLPQRTDDVPEEYIGAYMRGLAMHECGHTLGLRHNFKGSTWAPNDKLQDAEWTRANGLSGSTMDYLPVNFSDDPEKQGEYFESRVGPYDVWAIRYGYTPLSGGTWGEQKALLEIAGESGKEGHAYGTDEDTRGAGSMDPDSTIDDIGRDSLEYCRSRLRLIDRIFAADWKRLASEQYGWIPVREGVTRTFNAKAHTLGLAAKYVGGVHHRRHHPGTEQPPIEPVTPEKQREALRFVIENGFQRESWTLSPMTMRLMAPSRWSHWASDDSDQARLDWSFSDLVRAKQMQLLGTFFMPVVQDRIVDNELRALDGQSPLTLAELYEALDAAIFREFLEAGAPAPDLLRRQLQIDFVALLRGILLGGRTALPEEARNQAWALLDRLQGVLGGVNPSDLATRAHARRLLRDVKGALDAYSVQDR